MRAGIVPPALAWLILTRLVGLIFVAAIAEMVVRSSSAATTIGAQEIGALGYFSDRTVVDAGGLVSPSALGKTLLQVPKEQQAEWCVINVAFMPPLLNDNWFRQAYELAVNRTDRGEAIEVYCRLSRPPAGTQ